MTSSEVRKLVTQAQKTPTKSATLLQKKINATYYQDMLDKVVFDDNQGDLPENFVFQQDNAPAHVAATTCTFFDWHSIPVLDWPPYYPDLNIIKNISKKVQRWEIIQYL
jgi:hypothetical protein